MRIFEIDGDDLESLISEIDEGGYTGTKTYKLQLRVYGPGADQVAFCVNDTGYSMPMGRLVAEVR